MSRRGVFVGIAAVGGAALIGLSASTPAAQVVPVAAGEDVQGVLDAVPPGSVVVLGEGTHEGPVTIADSISLTGVAGAEVTAPPSADAVVTVTADDVTIDGLTVRGGWTGIDLIRADHALLRGVSVVGAELQGIRVYARSATVEDSSVAHMTDPHAQGIEVLSAPDVVVRRTSVVGGKIGIVAHLSTVDFERNSVSGTTQAGVVIREMSRGSATANLVTDASGAGLYCGDMSTCSFRDNRVRGVGPAGSNRSAAGWGLVVHYRSTASTHDDVLNGDAGRVVVLSDSRLSVAPATRLGIGAGAAWPAISFSLAFVVALAVLTALFRPAAARIRGPGREVSKRLAQIAVPVILVFLAVQTFHMLEHVIQLVRVHGRGVPGRGGLAGQVVDNEVAHFAYNAVVLAGLGAIAWWRYRGWTPGFSAGKRAIVWGDRLLLGTLSLQGYHLVEHSTKLVQHFGAGIKVAPGILGDRFDLVYLHFGINAAVYLGFALAVVLYLFPDRNRSTTRVPSRSIVEPI